LQRKHWLNIADTLQVGHPEAKTYKVKERPSDICRHPDAQCKCNDIEKESHNLQSSMCGNRQRSWKHPHQDGPGREEDDKGQRRHNAMRNANVMRHIPVNMESWKLTSVRFPWL
jgi:hypothetical protein